MRLAISLLLFLFATNAFANSLSIQIVDNPDSVLVYSPRYITFQVENRGSDGLLIPINELWQKGWRFEISENNTPLLYPDDYEGDRGTDHVTWLNPGEKYLFYHNLGPSLGKEGVYEISCP